MDNEKKYKEALGKARQLCAYPTSKPFISDLQDIFPELKESEDEKIRKGLLYVIEHHPTLPTEEVEEFIAWLEKKADQKPDTDFSNIRIWKYIVDAVLTEKEGIGQYLDSPFTEEVAKKLQKRFGNIEQKPTDLPNGEDYGIDGLYHAISILERTLGYVDGYQSDDGILEHECAISAVKKLYEQKQDWSEQDEYNKRQVCRIIREAGCSQKLQDKINSWLESFRFQPHWKPSDEQMKGIECAIKTLQHQLNVGDKRLNWLYDDLKKLKEGKL